MNGFELQASGIRSNGSANWATTTAFNITWWVCTNTNLDNDDVSTFCANLSGRSYHIFKLRGFLSASRGYSIGSISWYFWSRFIQCKFPLLSWCSGLKGGSYIVFLSRFWSFSRCHSFLLCSLSSSYTYLSVTCALVLVALSSILPNGCIRMSEQVTFRGLHLTLI